MQSESTFRPVVWLMSGRILGQAAAFLIPVVLARVFDTATFGSYKRLFLLYGLIFGVAQLGFSESLYYFLPRSPKSAGKLTANAMVGLAVAGGLCWLGLTLFRHHTAALLGDPELANLVPWVGLFTAPMLISSVLEISMVSRKSPGHAALAYMASDLVRAAFLVVPALLFFSLRAVIAGAIGFALVRLAGSIVYLWKDMRQLGFDRSLLKEQLGYSLPFALAVGVDVLQQNFSQVVVSNRVDAATFAIYSVALLQVPLVDQTATTTSSVAMVQMGEAQERGDVEAVSSIWQDAVAKLGLLFFPLVALLMVGAREVITVLFTDRYAASVPLFRLGSIGILLFMLQTDTILRVLAQTRFLFILNMIRMALAVALIYPGIAYFGLAGAIGSTLIASVISRVIAVVHVARLQKTPISRAMPWRPLALASGMSALAALAAWVVRSQVSWPAFPRLVLTGAVFTVAYVALARFAGLLPPIDPRSWVSWVRGTGSAEAVATVTVKE